VLERHSTWRGGLREYFGAWALERFCAGDRIWRDLGGLGWGISAEKIVKNEGEKSREGEKQSEKK